MREKQNKIKIRRGQAPGRLFNFNMKIVLTGILTVLAALIIVFGARAIQTAGQNEAGDLIKVPGNYPTIQAAIDAAGPGDIIQVRAGVYNESVILNKPVSLIAESFDEINAANNSTIIDGGGGAATIVIPSDLTQMPVIRGFVIRNGVDGIQASSAFIAEHNYFYAARNLVSYQKGGGGVNRDNVYFNAIDNGIRLDNMDRPLLIENNRILFSGDDAVEISLQNTTAPPAVVEIDIWNNMIIGSGDDGIQLIDHTGDPQDTNRRIVVAGNLIANNMKAGIGLMPNANTLEDYSGADMAEAVRVFNNTFFGNDYGISGGDNVVAFNNIIANSLTRGVWKVQGQQGANAIIANTLFHNNGMDAEQSILGVGNILGLDPLFEAEPNAGPDGTWATVDDDFSGLVLRSDSPAIDMGVTQFIANNGEHIPPSPITGFTGAAPDLGWREFGAPLFSTPTPTPISSATPLPTLTASNLTPLPTITSTTPVSPTSPPITPTAGSPTALPSATSLPATPTPVTSPTIATTATVSVQVTIQGVNPNTAQANTTATVTLTGSGFESGALVNFEGGSGPPPEVVSVQVVNSNTITVTLNATIDGSQGAQVWDIRVTNPDNSSAILADAFTIVPPR